MRLTAASLLALTLACFWLVGAFDREAPEHTASAASGERAVVLVSIDGFRADYLDREDAHTPTLDWIAGSGVRADGMTPVYPSVTLPNHWSLVTGLHPEEHGIVGNEIRDARGRMFQGTRKTGDRDPAWWGGEPIWATAERQGLRAGTVFWPGSHVVQPGLWRPYDAGVSYTARVDTALAWLDLPLEARPHFVTLYFEGVDGAGHERGPLAPETARAMEEVDRALSRFVDGLEARGRLHATDLVVVSDHGMTALSRQRLVFLDDAVDLGREAEHVLWSEPTGIWPASGVDADALVARIDALEHVRAYRREDTPAHLRFRHNDRIAPVVVVADLGWSTTTRARAAADPAFPIAGSHGYDVREADMRALFIARGPSFLAGVRTKPLATVDVHGILAGALEIEPAKTSGDPEAAARVLRPQVLAQR